MTAIWPTSLPQSPLAGTLSETAKMAKNSFESDTGPAIERPRGTIRLATATLSLHMTDAQLQTFEHFVFHEIGQGSMPFHMPNPKTGVQSKVKITGDEPYQIDWLAPNAWRVSMSILVIG